MADIVTLRITGVDELLKKLDPEILAPIVKAGFSEIAAIARPQIASRTPVDTGRLVGSISTQMDSWRVIPQYVKIGPTMPHTHLMELGVQPGHFPPYSANSGKNARRLRAWVRGHIAPTTFAAAPRKTGRSVKSALTTQQRKDARESALDRATFLVARGIFLSGVKARRFLAGAFTTVAGQLDGVVSGMVDHLEAEWDKVGGKAGGAVG